MKQFLPTLQRDIEISDFKNNSTDEKYISIKYDTWEKKYKPMVHKISELNQEISRLQESKRAVLCVKYFPAGSWHFDHRLEVAQLDIEGGNVLTSSQKDFILRALKTDIEKHIDIHKKDTLRYLLVSHNLAESVSKKLEQVEQAELRIENRLSGIGKFWRWLLNIK